MKRNLLTMKSQTSKPIIRNRANKNPPLNADKGTLKGDVL